MRLDIRSLCDRIDRHCLPESPRNAWPSLFPSLLLTNTKTILLVSRQRKALSQQLEFSGSLVCRWRYTRLSHSPRCLSAINSTLQYQAQPPAMPFNQQAMTYRFQSVSFVLRFQSVLFPRQNTPLSCYLSFKCPLTR